MKEELLHGGDLTAVLRVADTARRAIGPWSRAVHARLHHVGRVGFDGAPRFLGLDEQAREILSFVEGEPGHAPVPAGDDPVAELGRLPRRVHDAQVGFRPPPDARWQALPGELPTGDVICHDALFWTNVVCYEAHRQWGGIEQRPGWRKLWEAGSAQPFEQNLRWLEAARPELEPWLARRRRRRRTACDT